MDNDKYINAVEIHTKDLSVERLQKTLDDIDAILEQGGPNAELFRGALMNLRAECEAEINKRS
jgi:hypothetical protein